MRKILIIICLFIVANTYSQQKTTPLSRAKRLIRMELFNTLNDFKSYAPVSYSNIEKFYSDPLENDRVLDAIRELNEIGSRLGDWEKHLSVTDTITTDTISEIIGRLHDRALEKELYKPALEYSKMKVDLRLYRMQQNIISTLIEIHKPEFVGMKITHTFRAKNSFGAYIISTKEFRFDRSINKILSIVDL